MKNIISFNKVKIKTTKKITWVCQKLTIETNLKKLNKKTEIKNIFIVQNPY